MKIERLLGLLSVLANTDKITVQEVAERFEVSRRTILRDLNTLNCAGIPIVSYPGNGGGVSVMENYKLNKKVLSAGDTEKIFTGLSALKSIGGDNSVTSLIAKLVPEKSTTVFSQSEYVIDLSSWFSDSIVSKKIARIHQAICECRLIRLEYIARNSRSVRIIEPHKLVFKQSNWYIYAFCRKREDFRLFKVSRIVTYEVMDERFQHRRIEKIDFGKSYGAGLFPTENQPEIFDVILAYDLADEFVLTDKIDASFFMKPSEGQPGCGQIRFQSTNLVWAADLVFSIIDKVQIVSPLALQTEIKNRLKKITSRFKGDI